MECGGTDTRTNTNVDRQHGGMFQLADADRGGAAFVCLGEKVECVSLCLAAPLLFLSPSLFLPPS